MPCINQKEEFFFFCGDLQFNNFPHGNSALKSMEVSSIGTDGNHGMLLSGTKPEISDFITSKGLLSADKTLSEGIAQMIICGADSL